ncbi:hypothetical protein AAY81_00090 [Denitrobacterium detoxificans]|uniref:Regulatory protein, luxR family n=1 Tax=Denitrobacterium detoxificans TaxID=79604 RepID=A0A172RVU8_9ACTN|nr:helix-turn-helix transcriptional regulator [Denitrobacterium detoxificans]ANE21837.1 hypothetical protein AAY81_00090 [Denitrobacterium detoxificans]SEO42472.1 regulatory protein, luxR family [Denitrobacterium detoxificans]
MRILSREKTAFAAEHLLWGAFLASFLTIIDYLPELRGASLSFSFAFICALVLVSCAAIALWHLAPSAITKASPIAPVILLPCCLAISHFAPTTTPITIITAVGCAIAFFPSICKWAAKYARHDFQDAAVGISIGVITSSCLELIAFAIPEALLFAYTSLLFVVGCFPILASNDETPKESAIAPANAHDTLPRIITAIADIAFPIAGLFIFYLITGSARASQFVDTPIVSANHSLLEITFRAVCAIPPILLALHPPRQFSLNIILQAVLPAGAALLLLPWMLFPQSGSTPANAFFAFGGGACFSSCMITSWLYVTTAIRAERDLAIPLCGITLAAILISVPLGFATFTYLGDDIARNVAPLCTMLFLLANYAILVLRPTASQPAAFNAGIEEHCLAIAQQYNLTPREGEVLSYIARGRSSTYIADTLCISPHTVKTHTRHIHEKLGIGSRQEIIDLIENE